MVLLLAKLDVTRSESATQKVLRLSDPHTPLSRRPKIKQWVTQKLI